MNADDAHDDLLMAVDDAFEAHLAPIPTRLTEAARAAFGWRRIDVELAELLFDSATDELAGVRGTATERRSLRFGAHGTELRVHLTTDSLIVMLDPPAVVTCRIATAVRPGEVRTEQHETDEHGELVVYAPDLPVRIEADLPSGTIVTPWVIG